MRRRQENGLRGKDRSDMNERQIRLDGPNGLIILQHELVNFETQQVYSEMLISLGRELLGKSSCFAVVSHILLCQELCKCTECQDKAGAPFILTIHAAGPRLPMSVAFPGRIPHPPMCLPDCTFHLGPGCFVARTCQKVGLPFCE